MQLPVRVIRGAAVLLLFAELLCTVPWPWSSQPHAVPMHPLWGEWLPRSAAQQGLAQQLAHLTDPHTLSIRAAVDLSEAVQYNSSALLRRSQEAMHYNRTSRQYETPALAVWYGTDELFYSKPADGMATWLDLLVSAKHPW